MDSAAERQRELQAIHEIAQTIARATELDEVCQEAVRAVCRALAADRASLLLRDEDGVMRFCAWTGLSGAYRETAEGQSPWTPDEPDPQPVVIQNVHQDDSLNDLGAAVLEEGIESLAFVPLVAGGRLIGEFIVYFDAPHELTSNEIRLTETIATNIALEIERRKAAEELRVSRDQLQAILRSVPAGITVQDSQGRLLYANDMAARLSGFSTGAEMVRATSRRSPVATSCSTSTETR